MQAKLLIVEDDKHFRSSLREYFGDEGFEVAVAEDGAKALTMLNDVNPDLVILDVALPYRDGLEVCQAIRQRIGYAIGIIMISGEKKEWMDRTIGLEVGADKYVTKPFETRELLAQVRALLRRIEAQNTDSEPAGWLIIDDHLRIHFKRRQVETGGQEVHLTPKEFELLEYLAQRPGIPCTRAKLIDAIWGYEATESDLVEGPINTCVARLRDKIEPNRSKPRYIHTVHGVGYCFEVR